MFPSWVESPFNPQAPIFDEETHEFFLRDDVIRKNMQRSWAVMLDFYGFALACDGSVGEGFHMAERALVWLTQENHNFRRITRILACLYTCGLRDQCAGMYKALRSLAVRYPVITTSVMNYWKDAARA